MTGPPDTRNAARVDARDNREQILDAAAELLAENPGARLAEIARQAGVSRATIYRHFSGVDAIRLALLQEVADAGRQLLQEHAAAAGQAGDPLPIWLPRLLRAALPIATRYARATAQDTSPDLTVIATLQPLLTGLLRQAQARAEVRTDVDAVVAARTVIVLGLDIARLVYRDGLAVEDAAQALDVFVDGLASPRRR